MHCGEKKIILGHAAEEILQLGTFVVSTVRVIHTPRPMASHRFGGGGGRQ